MTTAYLLSERPFNFDKVPPELAKIYPIEKTLDILGFDERSDWDCPKRSWGPLEVVAAPWIASWYLIFSTQWRAERVIPVPYELCIPLEVSPIVVLSIIHEAWDSWFNWMETPQDLQLGKEFGERNWEEQQREYLNRPRVWAEREFFRFCIGYLDKFFDWAEEDFRVELSYTDGQLKLSIGGKEVYCPARGKFNGKLSLSARHFLRYLPKRFFHDTVLIEVIEEDKVLIGSRLLPRKVQAKWEENPSHTGTTEPSQ